MTRPITPTEADLLQARVATRLAASLGEQTESLPADVTERLRFAREQALVRASAGRRGAMASVDGQGAVVLAGGTPWWLRLATFAPLAVLLVGLLAIEQLTAREQVLAAAEIDALLLSDDVPPDGYRDPGFLEFLRAPPSDAQ